MNSYPNPDQIHPLPEFPQVCFIKNVIKNPQIIVGDYTYYDDPLDSVNFERNVLYHYPFSRDRLIIGKFCAIAQGVTFMMNDANHCMDGFSTYPFEIFGQDWQRLQAQRPAPKHKGDTVIGHDVWLGYQSLILPGIQIGSGAIIGAKAVVSRDVPAYAIVAGNPARVVRYRFGAEVIQELLDLAWWDWPREKISRNLELIVGGDIDRLKGCT
ncbi:CatB-related O-acetyltransferase [Candidatus Synechococcus calcipolaris G9]|uniref:CatB-related O-acetyltransferase n=1 Tax=Candidatus Synechococcus calcipolaris G9 TaxID=1497997 RepID=A0ABT6EVV0_9SYNE|nr:CatB-related O-acetyltransferase [Candidatus Synechococcus calcipolaris]MDG2989912.1 CatB-related O-acetyltransferase [Candidatus Synechococcus calcipolaris G9]